MGAMSRPSRNPISQLFHWGFRRKLPLETETSIFILVNVLDFVMTWWMLMHREMGLGNFYESNPVARFFLDHWGVKGLLYFKMGVVAFVCVIAQIVATRREASARFLLVAGTLVVSAVVIYSLRLFLQHVA
jgi:hypothetical protein